MFDLYLAHPIDFADAYHVAPLESRGETEVWSFDQDFDRIATLERIEPPPQAPPANHDNVGA